MSPSFLESQAVEAFDILVTDPVSDPVVHAATLLSVASRISIERIGHVREKIATLIESIPTSQSFDLHFNFAKQLQGEEKIAVIDGALKSLNGLSSDVVVDRLCKLAPLCSKKQFHRMFQFAQGLERYEDQAVIFMVVVNNFSENYHPEFFTLELLPTALSRFGFPGEP